MAVPGGGGRLLRSTSPSTPRGPGVLRRVWRSVSTAALSELKDADAALPVVPAAGVSTQGAKRPNVGDDGAVHPSRCVSRRLDAGSEASAGVEGQARNRVDGACNASVLADTYFEIQTDAWCGMHALNNLVGGPYVTRDDCLGAARQVVSRSAQTDPDDLEVLDNHLHKDTGFLSIDVHGAGRDVEDGRLWSLFRDITRASNCGCVRVWCGYYVVFRLQVLNILGESQMGVHVEEAAMAWEDLREVRGGCALLNWNTRHWTVLRHDVSSGRWVHQNSIIGDKARQGCRTWSPNMVLSGLLSIIRRTYGGWTLHRVTRSSSPAAFRRPIGPDQVLVEHPSGVADRTFRGDVLRLASLNVDGLNEYASSPASRMERILGQLLPLELDALLFQEVTEEMHAVVRRRLPGWRVYHKRVVDADYFNVTACRSSPGDVTRDRTTTYEYPGSEQGRHLIIVRRAGWTLVNVHAESGGDAGARARREHQLRHTSRMPDWCDGGAFVLAGDFNLRGGDDGVFTSQGWSDASVDCGGADSSGSRLDSSGVPESAGVVADSTTRRAADPDGRLASVALNAPTPHGPEWTWCRGQYRFRFDRVFLRGARGHEVRCSHFGAVRSVWGELSDHVALHAVLRRRCSSRDQPSSSSSPTQGCVAAARAPSGGSPPSNARGGQHVPHDPLGGGWCRGQGVHRGPGIQGRGGWAHFQTARPGPGALRSIRRAGRLGRYSTIWRLQVQ